MPYRWRIKMSLKCSLKNKNSWYPKFLYIFFNKNRRNNIDLHKFSFLGLPDVQSLNPPTRASLLKGYSSSRKNENFVIISSPSCCSKPVWVSFFSWAQKKIFWRMLVTKQLMVAIDLHIKKQKTKKTNCDLILKPNTQKIWKKGELKRKKRYKRDSSPKNENSVIIYSLSCCSKPIWFVSYVEHKTR